MTATDDVYNHLNEKEKAQDDDSYDHACATSVSRHANDSEDYSNQHVLDDFAMSGGTETDDYSTIEKIKSYQCVLYVCSESRYESVHHFNPYSFVVTAVVT